MKLVIERAALAALMGGVAPVAARPNTMPILACARLRADADGRLAAEATNLDLLARDVAPARVERPGTCCVEAQRLADIAKALPDGADVEMEVAEGAQRLELRCGRSRFRLDVLPGDDYPAFGPLDKPAVFDMAAGELRRLLRAVRHAVGTEQARPYLNGVYLHVKEGRFAACATNGLCLAVASAPLPDGAAAFPDDANGRQGVILPREAAELWLKVLPESGTVGLSISSRAAILAHGDALWRTKLIDGVFPDYERVVPSGDANVATFDVSDLMAALRRVVLAAESGKDGRCVAFDLAGDGARLRCRVDGAEAEETVETSLQGPGLTVGFNGRYVLDAVAALGGDTVDARLDDPATPAVLTNPAATDPLGLCVVMPMRVH